MQRKIHGIRQENARLIRLKYESGMESKGNALYTEALAGNAMGDPARWGLDGAACAAFLGLLWPRLHGRDPIAIAVVCAVATIVCIPLTPPGLPIIIAAVVAAAVWASQHRRAA